jgi:hypothetical protein
MTTVALYARVSIRHKGHSTENQLPELWPFAQAHSYIIYNRVCGARVGRHGEALGVSSAVCRCTPRVLRLGIIRRFSHEGALPDLLTKTHSLTG